RWLASKFLSPEAQFYAGVNGRELQGGDTGLSDDDTSNGRLMKTAENAVVAAPAPKAAAAPGAHSTIQNQEDAPTCSTCGSIMIRSGACYKCANCGNTSGCA